MMLCSLGVSELMKWLVISFLWIGGHCIAQKNRIQEITEVTITFNLDTFKSQNKWEALQANEIEALQANDAAGLIRKFTSTSIKSYGGIGGLKTVSSRGLGANHSKILADGFGINNIQNGQVNLGQIHSDNIIFIRSNSDGKLQFLQPISAQVAGSQFSLETFENNFGNDGLQFRLLGKQGSFNQWGSYGALKFSSEKFLFSTHGSFRRADGNYPFTLVNGNQTSEETRSNNDYLDYHFGLTSGIKTGKSVFRLGYMQKEFDQGLPGAVILYNNSADERITSRDQNLFGDHVFKGKKVSLRSFIKMNENNVTYTDPNYLNQNGGIDVSYRNQSLQVGIAVESKLSKNLKLHLGVEEVISDLLVSDTTFARPKRYHNYAIVGMKYHFAKRLNLSIQLSEQFVNENNSAGKSAENKFKVNPYIAISTKEEGQRFGHEIWYRNSFRMPTFNELYYNNIGNIDLKPEEAHQINYGWSYSPRKTGKFQYYFRNNIYLNYVNHKIVAIPSKNLFTWSMQNVERANILGTDFKYGSKWKPTKYFKLNLDLNYSLQSARDVSRPDSPSYNNQIAYIPVHTGNIDLSLTYKKIGLRFSNYTNSLRYTLNENISANQVEGFWVSTLSTYYSLNLKNKNILTLRFTIKNLFNSQYAVIRSFIMPGRNYLIVLKYAFN